MSAQRAIELSQIDKRFGEVRAVDGLSLAADEGELLVLVGPSGCGKTTLLRLIAGFDRPDAGEIRLGSRNVLGVPPEDRDIGIVFQNYALFPHMSVFDNIGYGLTFSKERANKRDRVRELLELLGLPGYEGRRPDELSAGQQQRVALARALAPNPKILLLDEPLSALDVQLRDRLRLEMRRIQRELGVTTVYVTHDQEEALAIADRVAVMDAGRLEQVDSPWTLYHEPRTPFVADFIGRGNLIRGRVAEVDDTGTSVVVELSDKRAIRVANHDASTTVEIGQSVCVLVRPEHLDINVDGANRLPGLVRAREFVGDALVLHVEAAEQRWLVKVNDPHRSWMDSEGQDVELNVPEDSARLYVVDSRTDTL